MLHTSLAALALAATALVASGCGGSSKTASSSNASATTTPTQTTSVATGETPTTESGKALTSAAFIARAEPICARANLQIQSDKAVSLKDYARILPLDALYFRTETVDLGKLVPPTSMASDWQQLVAGFRRVSEDLAKAGDYVRKNALKSVAGPFQAANKTREHVAAIAQRDGLKECSRLHR